MEIAYLFSTFREIFYVFLFSLSKESVRAWIKQHPKLKPYFCGLETKTDLVERITSSVASATAAVFSACDSAAAPNNGGEAPRSSGSSDDPASENPA